MDPKEFYTGKKVLITGHTGFKGSWMCKVLDTLGAEIIGYSLKPPTNPNLYSILRLDECVKSFISDIRDFKKLDEIVSNTKPDIIIHMAAQPLVSVGYSDPVLTYSTNVEGTVNILEAVRNCSSVKSLVNVTTDKVYYNREWAWGYREDEYLDGYDPYSNSKSCSELITSCYRKCFLDNVAVSTVRAGNVIGGGDFTNPRIIPDCIRAAISGDEMILRNPKSTRPYQHVLEPVFAYLMIAAKQSEQPSLAGSYNIGPRDNSCIDNETLVSLFEKYWGSDFNYSVQRNPEEPHEANYLKLDCSKIKSKLGWSPKWDVSDSIDKTVQWTKAYLTDDAIGCTERQIEEYLTNLTW